jgi:hypothetical protein
MQTITTVDEAKLNIESFAGAPEDFVLPISDEMQDPIGVNMAIITDCVLAKGWEPNGFEKREGYRVYRYKLLE